MKPLTILFDADDTVENLLECWVSALNRRYGTTVSAADITDWDVSRFFPTLTKSQVFEILSEDTIWQSLSPIPGSQFYLQALYDEGHQLYMVTASDYRTCKVKMERIFEMFPFLDWNHVILTHNKQMVQGDILIDDGPHNLIGGSYFKILFNSPHNRAFDTTSNDIVRADSWEQVYNLIQSYCEELEISVF